MEKKSMIPSVIFFALAVFCIAYGICVLRINSGSVFYLAWFAIGAFMVLIGICFAIESTPVIVRRLLLVLLAVLAGGVLATWGFILSDFQDDGESNLDYIVVLGAQVKESGPSRVLRNRLDTAAAYLNDNPKTLCVVSGGQGANEPEAEGAEMRKFLIGKGIAEERIIAETESTNTVQNLVFSKQFLNAETDRVGVVTNNFHVFRAVHIAEKNGYKNVCGIAAPSNRFYLLNNMLRESCGVVKDLIAGNM